MALSKVKIKSLDCEAHYAGYHLDPANVAKLVEVSDYNRAGKEFHAYRASYIQHLVFLGLSRDVEYAELWMATQAVSEEGRVLIRRDVERFILESPEAVYGTEVYLSIDAEFCGLDCRTNTTMRQEPSEGAVAHGFLDLLLIAGDHARAVDYKTGFNTQNVDEREGAFYAALVFANFPTVESVDWAWEFTRSGSTRELSFRRYDLDWIFDIIRNAIRHGKDIAARHAAGERMNANPYCGLCRYCELNCPIRREVTGGKLLIEPVKTEDEAKALAARMKAADDLTWRGRKALREYLDECGRLELDGGYVAEVTQSAQTAYPLVGVMNVLGVDLGETSKTQDWDIPLDRLIISSTSIKPYLRAKKRAGLSDKLDAIATTQATSELKIYKPKEVTQ